MPGDGEHRRSGAFQPRYEGLDDQTLQNRLYAGAGKTRDGAHVARTQPAFAAGKGESPGLGLAKANTEAGLEQTLLFGQELLLEEGQLECLPRPVVLDDRRNAPESPPTVEDGPDAGPGLFAQTYAAEGADDPGVTEILLSGVQELLGRCESVARIPQQRAVVEEPDRRLAGVIGIVLVDQQIDRGLPEGNVIRRPVDPLQCLRIDGKRLLGAL